MGEPGLTTQSKEVATLGFTDDLIGLGELSRTPSVECALSAVRELLGMELALCTRFTQGNQVVEVLRGEAESFGLHQGLSRPLHETYCDRVMAGRLPNLIPDVRADDRAASLPMTEAADIGAFASVPLTFSYQPAVMLVGVGGWVSNRGL